MSYFWGSEKLNIPSGQILHQGIPLAQINFKQEMLGLIGKNFSGYVALAVDESFGTEESTILLRRGKMVAASHSYLNHNKTLFGKKALAHALNAAASKKGVMDVAKLSDAETELAISINPEAQAGSYGAELIMNRYVASFYSRELFKRLFKGEEKTTKHAIFKKLGIDNIKID